MPRHQLTHVNIPAQTAVCSVCGPTEIYVVKSRTSPRRVERVYCRTKIREHTQAQTQRLREQKRLENPNRKPRHSLSKIDPKKLTAICSVCGRTDIRQRLVGKKGTFYSCANKKREYARDYRLAHYHYVPHPRKPRGHSLSKIDDKKRTAVCLQCGRVRIYISRVNGKLIRRCSNGSKKSAIQARQRNMHFIDEYKIQRGCQRCGYNASPVGLDLHNRNPQEKDLNVKKACGYGRQHLLRELEKCDVLCAICHRLAHHELGYT